MVPFVRSHRLPAVSFFAIAAHALACGDVAPSTSPADASQATHDAARAAVDSSRAPRDAGRDSAPDAPLEAGPVDAGPIACVIPDAAGPLTNDPGAGCQPVDCNFSPRTDAGVDAAACTQCLGATYGLDCASGPGSDLFAAPPSPLCVIMSPPFESDDLFYCCPCN